MDAMSAVINGSERPVNDDLVKLLAKALAEAKRGEWQAGAVVLAPNPVNAVCAFAASQGCEFALNFGADLLKASIGAKVMQPRQSPIVRPAGVVPDDVLRKSN